MSTPVKALVVAGRVPSTPAETIGKAAETAAEALSAALAALRALEEEHATSAATVEARRTRSRDAEQQVGDLTRKLAATDPDSPDLARLSTERQLLRDRGEVLRAQLGKAEAEHKALGGRVQQAQIRHQRAERVAAIARIHESSARLTARWRALVGEFAPEVAEHFALVVAENRARAAINDGGSDPFTVWGEGSPDPATIGFWNMVTKAYTQSFPAGEERLRFERSLQTANSMWGSTVPIGR